MNDFFDKNFDMTNLPSFFITEEGKKLRRKLAAFFQSFHSYYKEAVTESGRHFLNFIMYKPFHMLFGIHGNRLHFVISNDNALRYRTGIYKIQDNTYLDYHSLSIYSAMCGFKEQSVMGDVDLSLLDDAEGTDVQNKIKKVAQSLVQYEINKIEGKHEIMRVNPIFGSANFEIDSKKVFMLMPFGDRDLDEFYEDCIKSTVTDIGMYCIRADDIFSNRAIIQDVWKNINEARIIIADLTYRNPNVFYEIGIAHALGKDVVLIAQNANDIPFDLSHIRTIIYKNTPRGASEFKDKIKETFKGIMDTGSIQ